MTAKRGKVYLVGAGPGDPKLITLKGLSASNSRCCIYDLLVNVKILEHALPHAERFTAAKWRASRKGNRLKLTA